MGTARRMMARSIEIAVKSWREPKMASLTNPSQLAARDCVGVCAIVLKRPLRQRRLTRLQKKCEKHTTELKSAVTRSKSGYLERNIVVTLILYHR
jgi:hypothetical protein